MKEIFQDSFKASSGEEKIDNAREILFRAKRIDNGEWVEGNLVTNERNERKKYIGYIFDERNGVIEDFDIVEVIPNTICQYTGLTDKNGNRIWENDILHIIEKMRSDVYHNGNLVSSHRWINESNFKVEFTPGGLMNTQRYANSPDITCEVIGNVFDSQELPKGE